jgi:hypothetical protein
VPDLAHDGAAPRRGRSVDGGPRPSSAWPGVEPSDLPVVDGNGWTPMASEQPMHHYVEQLEGHLERTAKRRPLRTLPGRLARSLLGRPD